MLIIPNVGNVVLAMVNVLPAFTSIVPLRVWVEIVKSVPSTTTFDPEPETVQLPVRPPALPLDIWNTCPAAVKLDGLLPVPSVLVPHVAVASRLPVAAE